MSQADFAPDTGADDAALQDGGRESESLLTRAGNGEDGPDNAGNAGNAGNDWADGGDYGLTFAEDVQVDQGLLKSFTATAREMGLPKAQAQKLADFYAGHAARQARAAGEAQHATLMEAKKGWESEIMSRPSFKNEVADARRTLNEFGGAELNNLLDQSLLGSHPVFFDFMARVGKALAEPHSRNAGAGSGPAVSAARALYPYMK